MADRVIRNRSRFPQSLRRKTSWEAGPFGALAISSGTPQTVGTNTQAIVDGLTVARLHGEALFFLSSVDAALSGFFRCAIGFCIVTEAAAAAGVGSMPSPIAEIEWDGWFYHHSFSLFSPTGTIAEGDGPATLRLDIDSKAMRKFTFSDVMVCIIECSSETGTAVVQAKVNTRNLVMLP